ncbi:Zn-finger protein [Ceratobasidium sp. AG-Ba]|nr:Zn-finger protein [Ceratobasidium sp. AG-Ba]
MSGGQQAYPVYLTIGNISKSIRRKASKRATVILGYLPVDSFKDVAEKSIRTKLRGELLHRSMEALIEPLKAASRTGIFVWCADGSLRHVYPILAAYIADWPEQNDVSCTIRSGCPVCQQQFHGRGSGDTNAPPRDHEDTIAAFRAYQETGQKSSLSKLNLKPWKPFWIDLPHVDFPSCITPDILHQLHKGVFKDYVLTWTEELLSETTVDKRFMAMPRAKDLRHFKQGITRIEQWTGRETKEMAKQYLAIVAEDPTVPDDFVKLVRALLDFLYLAQSAELTDSDVDEMTNALKSFHSLKKILVELDIVLDLDRFDHIPKFHMLGHYAVSIRELGTPDGYNTESPEHLHIVYTKHPWRASNRREAIKQIINYIRRLDAVRVHRAYMDEFYGELPRQKFETYGNSEEQDDEDADEDEDQDQDWESEAVDVVELDASDERSEITYPRPTLTVAMQPTCPRVTGEDLMRNYGATDLIRSLARFLKSVAPLEGFKPLVFPSDRFDTWHKIILQHQPLPFARSASLQRDVIRINPPNHDQSGLFDTVMFVNKPEADGLHRYRVGRVRAIFSLPPRLRSLHSGCLAYIELFTPFKKSASGVHGMYSVSPDYHEGRRRAVVVPIEQLAMACQLGPRFCSIDPDIQLHAKIDTLALSRRFFLNPFYNQFSYLLMRHWLLMAQG